MAERTQDKIRPDQFDAHYRAKTTPWDLGRPDFNLIDAVTKAPIKSCIALDIGCGSGHNSIWLAQQGFLVTGVDVSETALQTARENASKANLKCTFLSLSFLEHEVPGAPFGFAFDRGCWHLLDSKERERFAERVSYYLEEGGLWLSIIGSADGPRRGPGPLASPPRHSANDITVAVERFFEILMLSASHFDSNSPKPPRAWACLMKKRIHDTEGR
jgi:methyl halide transferase